MDDARRAGKDLRAGKRSRKSVPWIIFAATILAWSTVFFLIAAKRYGGDIRGFLNLGQNIPHPGALADAPKPSLDGYDGQFYVALATDPLIRHRETGESLDNPAFRGSRAMIPLLAWILAAGNAGAAVYAYELLCWALGCAAILIAALMLSREGDHPAWALALIPGAGLAASLLRSTPDAGTLAFILAALWLHRRGRFAPALVFAIMAALSREIAIILALGLALEELRKKRIRRGIAFAAFPAAALLAWKTYLQLWLGSGFSSGEKLFDFPFFWAYRKIGEIVLGRIEVTAIEVIGVLGVAASLAGIAALISRKTDWAAAEFTYLGFGILIPFLSYSVFVEAWGYTRILVVLPFLAVILAERQDASWRKWTLRSVAAIHAMVGLIMIASELVAAIG
jgi:hypothetical protein